MTTQDEVLAQLVGELTAGFVVVADMPTAEITPDSNVANGIRAVLATLRLGDPVGSGLLVAWEEPDTVAVIAGARVLRDTMIDHNQAARAKLVFAAMLAAQQEPAPPQAEQKEGG